MKIWEEVLRAAPIGINEDFFELGGDSLLAIRMLAQIEKVLHKKITLATLMFAPTIEHFARTLCDPALTRPQIFGIQPNGVRPPFFCVGAGPLFRTLASRLGTDQPVLGVPLPDMDALPVPCRLEDIAAHCTETLLEVQPQEPYLLGGWSDAGVIAYEMAQQLEQRGQTVSLVVLFDAQNQAHRPQVSSKIESARMHFCMFSQWLKLQSRTILNLKPRELTGHLRDRLSFRLAWLRGLIWGAAYRTHLHAGWRFNHGLHNIEYVSVFASKNYQPRPYHGSVVLFQRDQRPTGEYRDPEYSWGGLASHLEIQEVPGNHIDMFLEPNVQVLADKLRDCLVAAQDDNTKSMTASANLG